MRASPAFGHVDLRSKNESVILVLNLRIGPDVRTGKIPATELRDIVRGAPGRAMQPQHDRVFLGGVVAWRNEQAILHRLAAGAAV